ncbi:hypothetical protein D1AOALGA4SA_9229 [Olavius algarvensis Delta 1 endosymbiont]|nr:hypothetical protein D1AOALGA4SA_9229 [Olavius algarvensis Delta 1 endosymbiont]
MSIDEWQMMESLGASLSELRPHKSLNQFKIDRSTKSSRQAEYLKSKIRIPKSKICFWKFLFFDQTGCPLAGGRARMKLRVAEGMWNGFDFYYFK